jgi:predicted phosphodiesterase
VHAGIRAALWTRSALSAAAWDHLARLPRTLRVGRELVVCHGSLDDPQHYLASPRRADEALAALARAHPTAWVLVAGHTHHQVLYSPGGAWRTPPIDVAHPVGGDRRWLVNPGSVGQSRDARPLARYARLDAWRGTVTFRELAYPHERTREKLARAGLATRLSAPVASGWRERVDAWRRRWAPKG